MSKPKTTFNVRDYQAFKKVALKSTVWKLAENELQPLGLASNKNIDALTRQILFINGISPTQAQKLAAGKRLTVPVISPHLLTNRHHLHTAERATSLRKIISHYYEGGTGKKRKEIAASIVKHPKNSGLNLTSDLDQDILAGQQIYLPEISPAVGDLTQPKYDFYRPELWLRRWVSVMRSLKSTIAQFRDVLVDIGPLTDEDIHHIVGRIIRENPDQTNASSENRPTTRTGHIQLMLDDLRREPFEHTIEDEAQTELTQLRVKKGELKKKHRLLEDEVLKLGVKIDNKSMLVDSLKENITILEEWQAALKAGEDVSRFSSIFEQPGDMDSVQIEPIPTKTKDDSGQVQTYVNLLADEAMLDPEFELKQLLNLYTLCWNLLVFVDESLGPKIASSLPGHWQAKHYRKHPPINLVQEALRRASADVEIIQRALVQRKRTYEGGKARLTRQAESLLILDKLALKSLAPFQHMLLDGNHAINPITYFSENTHIRRVPYVENTLLVGIAYAHASHYQSDVKAYDYLLKELDGLESENYWPSYEVMAIPHEAGHFAYHHAIDPETGKTMADLTAASIKNDEYGRWYEEIFADVYGCFISGPLTAMGMQGLLAGSSVRGMSRDDGEHPVPIFRPFILSEILRELTTYEHLYHEFEEAADALDENWEQMLRLRGYIPADSADLASVTFSFVKAEGEHHDHYDESREKMMASVKARTLIEATVPQVLAAIRPMIAKFVKFLAENVNLEPWHQYKSDLEYGGERFNSRLSLGIPWTLEDYADLYKYDEEMWKLTNEAVEREKVPNPPVQHGKKSTSAERAKDHMAQQMRVHGSAPIPEMAKSIRFDPDEAEQMLLNYLDKWGDSGPGGWGNYP